MDVDKEIHSNKVLFVVSENDYYRDILDTLKYLSGKSVCYVSLNKTRGALVDDFKKNKIDSKDIIIVDAISKTIKIEQEVKENCYLVSSPGALTELSIAIKKFLDYKFEYLIFDSLSNLLTYRDAPMVKKWISSIAGSIKESSSKAVFYMGNFSEDKDFAKEISVYADKIIELRDKSSEPAPPGQIKNEASREENEKK